MSNKNKELFPYVSGDYYSEKFANNELRITKEILTQSEAHIHRDEIEFIYIYKGNGTLMINGNLFDVSKGNLALLMPYHIHSFILEPTETLSFYRIRFSIGFLLLTSMNRKQYLESMLDIHGPVTILNVPKLKQELVLNLCKEVVEEHSIVNQETGTLDVSLISYLIYLVQTVEEENILETKKNKSWEILEYLQVHHQEQITREKIAKQFSCTDEEINYHLRTLTGVGFSENLNRVRVRNAVVLLQFDELSIRQISEICGYKTEANFYKNFKQLRGVTPQTVRELSEEIVSFEFKLDAWEIYIYIQENYQQNLSLSVIADMTNTTEKQINRLLKKSFNKTFLKLLTETRLRIARNILLVLDKGVEETAISVGFPSSKAFSQAFKEYYGETPKQFSMRQHK